MSDALQHGTDAVDFVPVSTVEVTVVVGRAAVMPCDTTSATNEDRVYMVLLFKQPDGRPIFSYDVRGRSVTGALEWSDSNSFASRARFITTVHPSALRVENVQLDDEGTYRCRVDFKNSPTKNYQIVLKVIVPPHKIVLFDEKGNDIGGVIGPLEEGDSGVAIEAKHASTKLLVRQKVTKKDAGLYSCHAVNSEGEATSKAVFLRVQYVPVCAHLHVIIVGVVMYQTIRVRCTVDADPTNLIFIWRFNNTNEIFEVSTARFANYTPYMFAIGGTSSELFYTATTDRDYGTLYCHAKNSVGVQEKPCVFHVVKATPPKKPRNCKWARVSHGNVEDDYLSVCCKGSYDRFLPQHYTLETIGKTYRVLLNNTETFPGIYTVRDDGTVTIISVGTNALKVRRDLDFCLNISWAEINIFDDEKIGVTAHNAVGASDTVIIKDFVYVPIVKHKDETSFELSANDIMLLSALLVAAVASTGFSMWFVRRRKLSSASSNKGPSQSMVQVDNQGRRRVVAVPTPTPVGEMATGPDVLNRRTDEPPRVVLESGENNTYDLRILSTNQEGIQSPQLSTDEEEYFGNQSSSVIHVAIHHRPRSSNIQDPSSDDNPEGVREVAV
ncbi:uncharacterized protein LOC113239558 [Hyposmocoma kahamanoa]|uniref:uncharacterized protein LOC113239558 n=1 Tax=Hyposmocoma kahamanoa TaxID=1477025 RepID=UPI000E6D7A45|nr:uncharacterized protein LOC113239558 [Hyposmocoma kahamanoa]